MSREKLYDVVFDESCEIEGRYFFEGEKYPVLKKDDEYVILCAENGDFCFSNSLMAEAITEWNLAKVE